MDAKEVRLNLSFKNTWWLRPVAYLTFFIMKLFRCRQDRIDSAMEYIFLRGIRYRVGNGSWRRAHDTQ